MMQILAAGGLAPWNHGERQADENNPEGYFEWDAIKRLPRDPHIIEQAEGKAVKAVSALLGKLPRGHRYKIIFMRGPIAEVVRSQRSTAEQTGTSSRAASSAEARAAPIVWTAPPSGTSSSS